MGNRAPEVFVIHTDNICRFADANFLRPIDDLAHGNKAIDVADIDSNVWRALEINNKHYGVPLDVFPWGIFYNKKIFREAGIVDENGNAKPPTNKAEFLDALKKLKKDTDGDGRPDQWGHVITYTPSYARTMILLHEGDLIDKNTKDCIINQTKSVEAVQFVSDLINKDELMPSPEEMGGWLGFRQGKVGFVFTGIYMLNDVERQKDLEYGVAPLPKFNDNHAVFCGSHNLCMSPELKGKKLDAAWKFIKFLSDNSIDWAAAGQVPVRKKVRANDKFKKLKAQNIFSKQIPHLAYLPLISTEPELMSEFGIALEKSFRGRCSAKEALDIAADRYKLTLDRQKEMKASAKTPVSMGDSGECKKETNLSFLLLYTIPVLIIIAIILFYKYGSKENRKFLNQMSGYTFLLPYIILFLSFIILPLVYGLGLSVFRWEMLSAVPAKFIAFGNYIEALKDPYFQKAFWATSRFVIMIVPLKLFIALMIAVGINSLPFKKQSFFRASYFLPTLISVAVAGILWKWFFNTEFGLFNAYLNQLGLEKIPWITSARIAMKSIVFMTLWWSVGGSMVILLAGLQNIPEHYYEAASIDGATSFQQFLLITMPLLKPVFLFVVVTTTIGAFQVFGQIFVITNGGPELSTRVVAQYIYETAFTKYRMGYGASMSWLLFLVIAAISAINFKFLKEK
jgi:ABC-type sugar transport system permease subunit/ABC-type glycerol-3-phosphate transport system substrate-binding protein